MAERKEEEQGCLGEIKGALIKGLSLLFFDRSEGLGRGCNSMAMTILDCGGERAILNLCLLTRVPLNIRQLHLARCHL